MPNLAIAPEDLAARLAARLCHDLMGPTSGLISGLDLLEDEAMRDDALELVVSSGRKLAALLGFCRVAFGAGIGKPVFDTRELEVLARGVLADGRAQLDWAVAAPQLGKTGARALLNLVQIAAGALAVGGTARATAEVRGGEVQVRVSASGPRARLYPEILAGLNGEALGEGLAGRWVQAFYVHALAASAGGAVSVQATEGEIIFQAAVPDD